EDEVRDVPGPDDRVHVAPDADAGPKQPGDRDTEDAEHPDRDREGDVLADGRPLRLRDAEHDVGQLREIVVALGGFVPSFVICGGHQTSSGLGFLMRVRYW